MRRLRFSLTAVLWAGACAAALSACGIITAGISVPEAFANNNDLGLKGNITDDKGQPMDDVVVSVKREYYLWHADASYPEFDTLTVMANHAFDIPKRRAHELTFTFRKPGFLDQTVVEAQHAIKCEGRWIEGDEWPLDTPVQIIMMPKDRGVSPLRWLALQVDYTDPAKLPVIDLSKALPEAADPSFGYSRERIVTMSQAALTVLSANDKPPAHGLYAVIERQATKTTGPERRVDPLDLNMPARLALRINDADAGFVPFFPKAGTHPLVQMSEAPDSGYGPELVLTDKRLRLLRDPASTVVTNRNEFFFFRANGQYGKGVLSWTKTGDETGPLRLFMALIVQPDGSRTLTLRGMP